MAPLKQRPKRRPRDPGSDDDAGFRTALETAKRESTLQVLFKVARQLDEVALARISEKRGGVRIRRSHTSLLPHIALEGTRITELAERLGITKQGVSQLVDDLEALGVLARVPDPDDARARRVVFTKRGREGFFEGLSVLRELEQEVGTWVGEKRMAQLRAALLQIHDQLSEREGSERRGT
jgi:DNA-binding MarR family transcriptional regulator